MKKIKAFLIVSAVVYSCQSFAVFPIVYDPYDVIQNTITAKNSIQALINQAEQLKCEVQNLKKLSTRPFEGNHQILSQLAHLSSQGQSLSYGLDNVDKVFDKTFPGLSTTKDYHQAYGQWSGSTRDTLKNSMDALSLQGKLFEDEHQALKLLQQQSDSVEGNIEAQQTAHRLQLEQIGQMQKLRQVLLNQASSQNAFMAYQLQKEQAEQASLHDWIQHSQVSFKRYDGHTGFGVTEFPQLP